MGNMHSGCQIYPKCSRMGRLIATLNLLTKDVEWRKPAYQARIGLDHTSGGPRHVQQYHPAHCAGLIKRPSQLCIACVYRAYVSRDCVSRVYRAVFLETGAPNVRAVSERARPTELLLQVAVTNSHTWACQTDAIGQVIQIKKYLSPIHK